MERSHKVILKAKPVCDFLSIKRVVAAKSPFLQKIKVAADFTFLYKVFMLAEDNFPETILQLFFCQCAE